MLTQTCADSTPELSGACFAAPHHPDEIQVAAAEALSEGWDGIQHGSELPLAH